MAQTKAPIIKLLLFYALLTLPLIFFSCENANEPIETNNLLIPEITNLAVTNNDVSFEWYSYNTLKISYEIDRKIEGEEYKPFARLDFTNYRITDSTLAKGIIATYRIRAVYKNRTSEYAYSVPVVRYATALVDSNFQNYYRYNAYKLNNGKFLLVGSKHYEPFISLIFDPQTNQISNSNILPINIEGFAVSILNDGNLLFAGGRVGDAHSKKSFLYNTQSNSWSTAADLLYIQSGSSSLKMPDGKILITGGYSSNGVISNKCEIYDPVLNKWAEIDSLNALRAGHAINLLQDGKVIVIGGAPLPGYTSNSCELYNPVLNSWTEVASLNEKRSNVASYELPNNNLIVIENSGYSRTVEVYNANNNWIYGGERKYYNNTGASTKLNDGRIIIVGNSNYGSSIANVEIYYPELNQWVLSNFISSSSFIWSVVTTDDNRVYVFGGLDQSRVSVIDLNKN